MTKSWLDLTINTGERLFSTNFNRQQNVNITNKLFHLLYLDLFSYYFPDIP